MDEGRRDMQTIKKTEMRDDHRQTLANLEAHKVEVRKREAQPVRFAGKSFADFRIDYPPAQKEVKGIIEKYAATFPDRLADGTSLIFSGKTGTGKTLLGLILFQFLIKKGFRAEYQPSLNFLRLLHEKQFESYHAFQQELQFYKELPFLIIDEVTEGCGKGAYPSDWERHLFRVLIDVRYQANRPTLIITNRTKQELIDRLGEPAIDRLLENGIALAFNWKSYRQA
jgi:DNA replication protein DnaC